MQKENVSVLRQDIRRIGCTFFLQASDFISSDYFQSGKPFRLEILLTIIILNTQYLSYIYNFGSDYVILVTIKSESMKPPPRTILCRSAVAKIKRAIILNRRAGELGVVLGIFYQYSFKSAFDVVGICTAYPRSLVSGTCMFVDEEVNPWLYFAAVLVPILIAVCSSSDVKAALRLKHSALTPMQYDPLLTCS